MRSVPPRFASEPPALAGPALEAEPANAAPTSRPAPITVAASAGRSFFCIGLPFRSRAAGGGRVPSGRMTVEREFS